MANVYEGFVSGKGLKFGIVVARFNEFITSKLLGGALDTLHRHETNDADIDVAWVPGAFELPIVAKKMAESGKYDAIIALGTVIRGSTTHYDGYRLTSRGAKGVFSLKMNGKNGGLTAMRAVNGDEDLMVITNKGIVIRTPISQIHIAGRNTVGVHIISLDPGNKVAAIAIVPHADETEEEQPIEEDEVNPQLLSDEEREQMNEGDETSDEEASSETNNPTPDDVE